MLRISSNPGVRLFSESAVKTYLGGGEANVAYSLAQFGAPVKYATIVPKNPLGDHVIKTLASVGVDTKHIVEQGDRLGTYYIELGSGARGAQAFYDRAYSAFALTTELPWDFDELFEDVEIFLLSGIVTALSDAWFANVDLLIDEAKKRGVQVAFDVNFRAKLWTADTCGAALHEILPKIDILSAGDKDAKLLLKLEGTELGDLEGAFTKINEKFPNIKVIYSSTRNVISSEHNELTGNIWTGGKMYSSVKHEIKPIVDRIGGGDALTAGVLYGLLNKQEPQEIIEFATAASHLKHTVLGDMNQFNAQEVTDFMLSDADVSR